MCSYKNLQNFIIQPLPLYTLSLFSIILNDDIVDFEKLGGMRLLTFAIDEVLGFFLHPSIFSIVHSRSA